MVTFYPFGRHVMAAPVSACVTTPLPVINPILDIVSGPRLASRLALQWMLRLTLLTLLTLGLAGCGGRQPLAASGTEAYALIPANGDLNRARLEYQIGPLDVLSITVFQEKDLTLEEVPVDASGDILFPLIGRVQVAGRTSAQVSAEIAARLGERFLVNPQVSVLIKTAVSQKVTVDGQVKQAGVYPLQGETTLVQAVALAQGASDTARLDQVVVFRQIGDKRYAARFNLADIQDGYADDPRILGGDTVIVGQSKSKAMIRTLLAIAPTLSTAFVAISQISN